MLAGSPAAEPAAEAAAEAAVAAEGGGPSIKYKLQGRIVAFLFDPQLYKIIFLYFPLWPLQGEGFLLFFSWLFCHQIKYFQFDPKTN